MSSFLYSLFFGGMVGWALVSPDRVAPSRMVGVSASNNLPLHHEVQKFSSCTDSPGWSHKKGRKMVLCVYVVLGSCYGTLTITIATHAFLTKCITSQTGHMAACQNITSSCS